MNDRPSASSSEAVKGPTIVHTLGLPMGTGVLIVGHGSRDPAANQEFESMVAAYRFARPSLEVVHGYVELAHPPLREALQDLARRSDRIVLLPLFLFAAGHVKNDLPLALAEARRNCPSVRFEAARPLGVHPSLVGLLVERARTALGDAPNPAKTALVVVGRGSSDPDANGDFCKVVRLAAEERSFHWVVPSFAGITQPLLADALELVARARPERVVVAPYFLFAGRLVRKLSDQVDEFRRLFPWIATELAPHLGSDERLLDLLDERVREAFDGRSPLPCDTCQYRLPLSGAEGNVGGLRAMLWSLRHQFTHTQAMPHLHAHRALSKHVLVCVNADCAARGSVRLLAMLRRLIKRAGRSGDIRVTRTLCMGRCGEGPTVAVYPDGIWYRGVDESDAQELVHEHLLGDHLVGRLVDQIMQ